MTSADFKSLRVLVVDDDQFMLELISRALEGLGIEHVGIATDGQSALDVLARADGKVDVLLCDLQMPGMDGIEFFRYLAEREYAGGIVIISGEDKRMRKAAGNLAQAHGLQLLGVLGKPVTRQALAKVLGRVGTTTPKRPHKSAEQISEEDLQRGLVGDELTLFFQPKVEVATRKVVGVEALARWNHPDHGILGPDSFVPLAEKCGLIDRLTDATFVKAMQQGGNWRSRGLELQVAVNISVDGLRNLALPDQFVSHAAKHGMEASQVILEVTESRLMQNVTAALEVLTRFRLKGISLSIDDFGTGYSTMEQLKRIPFDELKLDRAFVSGALQDSTARAILDSSIGLAQELGLRVVAEGVETQEDWNLVKELGCHQVQGYFVAKPMPGEQLAEWVSEWYLDGVGPQ